MRAVLAGPVRQWPSKLTPQQLRQGFQLGDRLVQPALNRIQTDGVETHLEPKVMAVLMCLAENAGEVVPRESLYDAVWGRTVVTDQALTNCISELRQCLGDDRAQPRFVETVPKRGYRLIAPLRPGGEAEAGDGTRRAGDRLPAGWRSPVGAGAVLLVVALGSIVWWSSPGRNQSSPRSVAVLPFENAAEEVDLNYLSLALPDEIATLLTASRELVVRPFDRGKWGQPSSVARSRDAGHVVTGHYYLEDGNRLTVAIEAQEVNHERLIWRARITVPEGDLLAMRERISARVSEGLLPALGVATDPNFGPQPVDPEAYQIYLRSLALPQHPAPTERAIEMLQRAVDRDPDFSPAWIALGRRWYDHGTYGEGRDQARENALAAYQKALAVDPASISAAGGVVTLRTEAGDLEAAYREARRLVDRFDSSARAHFALAYVYRFGGLLKASQHHCEIALELDPHDSRLRSCGYSYLYAGELERVREFLDLDEGSYFSHWGTVLLHLRQGDDAAALNAARQVSPDLPTRLFMEPCLEGKRGEELDGPAAGFISFWTEHSEPELAYALAPMLEYCGRHEDALSFLNRAIRSNFCSFPALDTDPIWNETQDDPVFRQLREQAIACHRRFREAVERVSAKGRAPPSLRLSCANPWLFRTSS